MLMRNNDFTDESTFYYQRMPVIKLWHALFISKGVQGMPEIMRNKN